MPAVATATGLPTRLGKYELLLPLATGGMARIYIGRSTGIGSFERHVVLKLITAERASEHNAVQMFLDEARLAAALNHQNVAQVFEVGEDAGIHYLAMEYVHGQDLRALLAKAGTQGTRIPLELALTVVAGVAAGLNHAHERRGPDGVALGIVHRDVSPSNIMIGYDGAVKLLDFGIAKATARSVETQSGIIKGKFAYMSPEQCRGRDVDRRSDVFSLGIILYEATTQHRCFRADSDFDTMHRIVTGDVVRPTRIIQGYPQALEAIVMKALAVDPAQRYQSAGLLLEAIESFAVAARMSVSTMGLGRFMRDMFGEVTEPWLNRSAELIVQRENTISSTNNSTSQPFVEASGGDDDSEGLAAMTVLDLPRGDDREPEPDSAHPDWNLKSYPPMAPANAVSEAAMRPSYPQFPATPTRSSQSVPPEPFAATGSVSAVAQTSPAFPSTRHGYASAADVPPPHAPVPVAPIETVRLKPNRRPVWIALSVIAVGAITLVVVRARGNVIRQAPDTVPVETAQRIDAASEADDQGDSMIQVKIRSVPGGADVLVAGTKIGVTPLDTMLKRGTKVVELAVHLVRYADTKSKIDLSGDVTRTFTLTPLDDAGSAAAQGSGAGTASEDHRPLAGVETVPKGERNTVLEHKSGTPDRKPASDHKSPATTERKPMVATDRKPTSIDRVKAVAPSPASEPKCQPPNALDPYDTSCNGEPCPPCK